MSVGKTSQKQPHQSMTTAAMHLIQALGFPRQIGLHWRVVAAECFHHQPPAVGSCEGCQKLVVVDARISDQGGFGVEDIEHASEAEVDNESFSASLCGQIWADAADLSEVAQLCLKLQEVFVGWILLHVLDFCE